MEGNEMKLGTSSDIQKPSLFVGKLFFLMIMCKFDLVNKIPILWSVKNKLALWPTFWLSNFPYIGLHTITILKNWHIIDGLMDDPLFNPRSKN